MRGLMWGLAVVAMAAGGVAGIAEAATSSARVTITSPEPENFAFSAPIFRWENLSSPGVLITGVEFFGGSPIDFVIADTSGPYAIIDPAGGSRTLLRGSESSVDQNDTCTNGASYGVSSFGPGESFQFAVDPEGGGCATAVIDYRPFLRTGAVTAAVSFGNGTTLSGNGWTEELIDPQGANDSPNQRFVLNLSQTSNAVPEPESWAMLVLGFGAAGLMLRRRRLAIRIMTA